eukprot:TRINITY_DN10451_c0_g1_i1.p1 TRINITY_DN10451_c0_g1~~TRINITY_DN10451_c0_g1_i1.p1  ORF type:complete len:291 (-),score=76.12 TRINITY_DN10451_c0_g1_i1:72-944(-)
MSTDKKDALETVKNVFKNAGKRAYQSGTSGAAAMVIQVSTLMWLRTTMNYQYRHGTSMLTALKTLYKDGGVIRFYRGYFPALAQGPLARFGDTAANTGVLQLLNELESTKDLNVGTKTMCASFAAAGFRIFLMPIDAVKTIMQVEGKKGFPMLTEKIRNNGVRVLWHGSLAASGATLVGHFPWFFTYNYLDKNLPLPYNLPTKLLRNATMGFVSSVISDTISNSVRVIKTTKQTHAESISYYDATRQIIQKDGVLGLMGRGLSTRILANGLQGLLFSVLWRLIDDMFKAK